MTAVSYACSTTPAVRDSLPATGEGLLMHHVSSDPTEPGRPRAMTRRHKKPFSLIFSVISMEMQIPDINNIQQLFGVDCSSNSIVMVFPNDIGQIYVDFSSRACGARETNPPSAIYFRKSSKVGVACFASLNEKRFVSLFMNSSGDHQASATSWPSSSATSIIDELSSKSCARSFYDDLTKSSFISQVAGMFQSKTILDSPVESLNVRGHFFALPRIGVRLCAFIDPSSSLGSRVRYSLHHGDDEG
uniref:Uncharacterized protein n=1 Tax=Fagus sylvatica TaxID=28930 RepID=A0A2N9FEF7_FAGSY